MALVYLKDIENWSLSSGLKCSGNKIELDNVIARDTFDDNSINENIWGIALENGSGSALIEETGSELTLDTTVISSSALVYYRVKLDPRETNRWSIRQKLQSPSGGVIACALIQESENPNISSVENIQSKELAEIAISPTGEVYFGFWDTSGLRYYWCSGKGWGLTQEYAYVDVLMKILIFEFENTGNELIFRIWNNEETEVLAYASVDWTIVRAEKDNLYIYFGKPFNNIWYGELIVSEFVHTGDYSTGQVATMGEVAIGTFIDQVPIIETFDSGANINWRYNKDGMGFITPGTGSLADLKSEIEGDYFNKLDLEASFITDGLAYASIDANGGVLGSKPPISFNLPIEIIESPDIEVISI